MIPLDPNADVPAAQVTAYSVNAFPDPESINADLFEIRVERRAPGRWAVIYRGRCLSADGKWDYESIPSERTDEWKAAHRFPEAVAIEKAQAIAPTLTVNGQTITDVVAWELANWPTTEGTTR